MINGNKVIFGYGDIATITAGLGLMGIAFRQLNNTYSVGECVNDMIDEDIQPETCDVIMKFDSISDISSFRHCLNHVRQNKGDNIIYGDIVLDFSTNYKPESVDIVIGAIDVLISNYTKIYAC